MISLKPVLSHCTLSQRGSLPAVAGGHLAFWAIICLSAFSEGSFHSVWSK